MAVSFATSADGPSERNFDSDPSSVAEARRFAVQVVADDGLAPTLELVVSELATNTVLHARTPFRIRVLCSDRTVRVEVFDASGGVPVVRDYGPESVTGRGLHIVEQLVDRWGVTPVGDGKQVWVEFDRPAATA